MIEQAITGCSDHYRALLNDYFTQIIVAGNSTQLVLDRGLAQDIVEIDSFERLHSEDAGVRWICCDNT